MMLRSLLKINAATVAGFALCSVLAVNANAQCSAWANSGGQANAQALSALSHRRSTPALPLAMSMAQPLAMQPRAAEPNAAAEPSIVGLWNTSFLSGGQLVDEGFDMWTADGLEVLNDFPPPSSGNVCVGVWSRIAPFTYQLNHPSWVFDMTGQNLVGTAFIREKVTLDACGTSFSGKATLDFYDLTGKSTGHLDADILSIRITSDEDPTQVLNPNPPACKQPANTPAAPTVVVTTPSGATAMSNAILQTPLNNFLLDATKSQGSGPLTFNWSSGAGSPVSFNRTGTNGQIVVQFPSPGDYVVNLKVTDSNNQSSNYSVTLEYTR